MAREQQRSSVAAEQLLGRGILGGLDFLDSPAAQFLELARIETRTQHRVRQQLQHQVAIAGQKLSLHLDVFTARPRVQIAADAFDGIGKCVGIT